jgi:glycerol-3-phosphate dehydrogenase (NAD(P)+)
MTRSVLVLGAGSWGTALALLLARNGHSVWLWSHDPQHVHVMQQTRQNAQYLPEINFPDNLQPIAELTPYILQVRAVVIVVPSQGFRQTLQRIAPYMSEETHLCWATKGLEYDTGLLFHQVAKQILGENSQLTVLSGPSFAKEVAIGLPTAVTIASESKESTKTWVELFHHANFRAYTSYDIIGVQMGGAIKNVIAIAAGIADGLGLGANSRAALITRGLTEMVRLGTALGGQRDTFMGLAGLGDLILTCTDDQSRNRRFGRALGQGISSQQAQTAIQQVIEGISTAREVMRLAHQHQIEMPIVEQVNAVLQGDCNPNEAVQILLSREPKQEH